ncbi:hypothetical protein [Veronia pacifica]|uniref:MSHA biogenesis protein MshK n=1 Tax=Veronia pacifica TaxID=1080227 RepID=A0A1C3ELP6_9GAMM|nr:hypothetical protein [Veronia pacifica]ODA34151.1 hypothetical protein A8L45_07680 [Veronia pacifica]
MRNVISIILCLAALYTATATAETTLPDPTAPLGYQPKVVVPEKKAPIKMVKKKAPRRVSLPRLDAVMCQSDQACVAILNGEMVEEGKPYKGFNVVKVTNDKAVLSKQRKKWTLTLYSEQVVN